MKNKVMFEKKLGDLGIKVSNHQGSNGFLGNYVIEFSDFNTMYSCTTPHGNCQNAALAYFNVLFNYTDQQIKNILITLRPTVVMCNKRNILIDIHTQHDVRIAKLFEDCIIRVKSPYDSSNRSKMTMWLIDISGLGESIIE